MYGANRNHGMLWVDDWANARRLCIFLENLYNLTLCISSSLYVTSMSSNNFLHKISNVACELKEQANEDHELSIIMGEMKAKYENDGGVGMMLVLGLLAFSL